MYKRVLSFALAATTLLAAPFAFFSQVQAQELPPLVTIESSVSVRVDGVKRNDLYAFITNLENDALWYPGILSSTLLEEGPDGELIGSKYHQLAYVNEFLTTNTVIEVLDAKKHHSFLIHGDGDIADYTAEYTLTPADHNSSVFTLTSTYTAPGLTEEFFSMYITYALSSLYQYYGTTGEVTIHYINVN